MQSAVLKKLLLATMLMCSAASVSADRQVMIEVGPIEQIIADVVGYTAQRATNELIKLANINTEQRGYTERYSYSSQQNYRGKPPALDRDSREELRELRQEHQRKLAKLERELDKDLRELSRDFSEDARDTRDRRKLAKKREKFQYKVDKAYYKFSEKVDKANDKFDQKRDKILRNAWAYNGRYNH
ncbi:hypothetical protein [Rheinheimera metallidurans]|uniref:hypothetical protein n=1 Tax=Rheinheimera metallidurans TaxID=2925781 RepID=UPI0030010BB2